MRRFANSLPTVASRLTASSRVAVCSVPRVANVAMTPLSRSFSSDAENKNVYSSFKIYKTKCALDVSVTRARLAERQKAYVLKKAGGIALTFASSIGDRKYDWSAKEVFTLNPSEIGDILANTAGTPLNFVHDPGMSSDQQGQTKKTLSIQKATTKGYFFNLNIMRGDTKTQLSVALSDGEMAIFKTLLQHSVPHLFAWNNVVAPVVEADDNMVME